MKNLLIWLVPPAVGAIIGYITNAVAIKMLFRPLKEVRFRGIRIPFTPGILPRQRHTLAENIGRMIERDLLTPDIIRQRLGRDDVRRGINNSIAGYTERLLTTPLTKFVDTPDASNGSRADFILSVFRGFIGSPVFDALGDALFMALLEPSSDTGTLSAGFLSLSIRDIAGAEHTEKLRDTLERIIENQLRTHASHTRLESLVPTIENVYPRVTESWVRFLKKPEIHQELEIQGRVFLSNAINKLSPFQRLFLSAGQYEKTIYDRMPEIIDDLIGQLDQLFKDDTIHRRLIALSLDSAQQFLSAKESYPRLSRFIANFVMATADKPLGVLMQHWSPEDIQKLGRKIFAFIKKSALNEHGPLMLRFFKKVLEKQEDLNLRGLFAIDAEHKEQLDALICGKLLAIADKETCAALETINVRTLVSERIDSLDMLTVEHIVLDVMANQFKWINLFGALLGALIGVFQSAFSWFIRGV
ncbi:MAG: DUF445 family protein [Treponema sp.]|jgi:uncharacterized membrane protein YheB (UPF0754 family)|nr:DUF445 family protein [Treponema sp.]